MAVPYEVRARAEIERWRDRGEPLLLRAFGHATAPIEWVVDQLPAGTAGMHETLANSVVGALEGLRDASRWTYSDAAVLNAARRAGIDAEQTEDLLDPKIASLEELDALALSSFGANKVAAAIEGAGCGVGGLSLIAADVPLLFGLGFRAVQQIGTTYGFRMADPSMRPVVYEAFRAGSGASVASKAAALADMRVAAVALAQGWSFKRVADRTITGVLASALKNATQKLPQEIARNVTKRKLAQAIPILGGAVGAGFNYWFMASVTESAYMLFRELRLDLADESE